MAINSDLIESLTDLGEHCEAGLGPCVLEQVVAHGELTVVVNRGQIVKVIKFLRDDPRCQFHICGKGDQVQ